MEPLLARRPPIKIGGEWRVPGRGPHDDIEVRVAYGLIHAPTVARFIHGVVLTQLTVFKTDTGYLGMLKGTRGKRKLVAFIPANTFRAALVAMATSLDAGAVPWGPDNPPKKG